MLVGVPDPVSGIRCGTAATHMMPTADRHVAGIAYRSAQQATVLPDRCRGDVPVAARSKRLPLQDELFAGDVTLRTADAMIDRVARRPTDPSRSAGAQGRSFPVADA
ncbi:hypothetical protein [Micromonospora sp. C95]|uniref:hypothetical protein n=1 Tax=Micromonospora sp. C95 TaxID=2824882 RepID=UPI001B37BE18|nr:hypothetical protein [Micromonospora sp. C95]MBQ1026066.1 hypothetical protein [Micromonospora sp. C95]